MPGFFLTDFTGMVPRVSARLLANNQAQNAINAKLLSGELEALKDAASVVTPSKVGTKLSIYRFGQDVVNEAQYWFHWTDDVDVARGPINNDTSERTYWTGETEPRVTDNAIALTGGTDYPMAWYKLGIPKPAAAPMLATDGAGSGDPKAVAVVYTYVSAWGEEGPPSDPSDIVSVQEGDELTISGMSTGPGAGYNIATKRIYLAVSGSTGADYRFLKEITVASSSTAETLSFNALGEVIPSRTWIPPASGLNGLIAMANGMMAGFLNNDVWLCEPYIPHAWPAEYRKSLPFGVVGLGAFDTNLVVVTKGGVYAGPAQHPSSLSLPTKGIGQAGVSKRGIVSFPWGVAYPCAAGLAWLDSAGWRLATDAYFTRDQWQALKPSSISGFRWGSRYVGFYDDGAGTQRGFIFDPADPRVGLIYTDLYATAGYNDPQRDALYLQIGADIKRWDASGTRSYTWKSKVFTMPKPINPAVAQVIATSYPVTLKLYADGSLKDTKAVADAEPFALSSGYKARDFEVQLEGAVNVRGVAVAESARELRELVT